ncbi:MAG: hypothetical protein IT206_05645 [Fimbriimonadaceae bacterium]|nr:hypothetical protein [Fimbriimonadaceae bacterium]
MLAPLLAVAVLTQQTYPRYPAKADHGYRQVEFATFSVWIPFAFDSVKVVDLDGGKAYKCRASAKDREYSVAADVYEGVKSAQMLFNKLMGAIMKDLPGDRKKPERSEIEFVPTSDESALIRRVTKGENGKDVPMTHVLARRKNTVALFTLTAGKDFEVWHGQREGRFVNEFRWKID